jgi:hypothetical protein
MIKWLFLVSILFQSYSFATVCFGTFSTKAGNFICGSSDELVMLDRQLSILYDEAKYIDKDEEEKYKLWIEERDVCVDKNCYKIEPNPHYKMNVVCEEGDCLKPMYRIKIKELEQKLRLSTKRHFDENTKKFTDILLNRQKKAQMVFTGIFDNDSFPVTRGTKNGFLPAYILELYGIGDIIYFKPRTLTNEEYSSLLYDYAYYLTLGIGKNIYKMDTRKEDFYYGDYDYNFFYYEKGSKPDDRYYLELAIEVLNQAIKSTPEKAVLYRLLGQIYQKLYILDFLASEKDGYLHKKLSYHIIPPFIKRNYIKYVKLCEKQNIDPELSEIERSIVGRQRMFFEVVGTTLQGCMWNTGNVSEEYIAMLNTMPDNRKTKCSRVVNEANSKFQLIKYDDLPKDYKKYSMPNINEEDAKYDFLFSYMVQISYHNEPLKYDNVYFMDYYDKFILINHPSCFGKYAYVDFSLRVQKNSLKNDCK